MRQEPLRAGGELEQVIDRYKTTVYGLALARTGSRADADDVFQEVFLAYAQSTVSFREEEHRKAWLLRTTVHMCRWVTASSWRRKVLSLSQREDRPVQFRCRAENELWQALMSLEETYRLPLYLFYFEELSTQEIARALGVRPGAVRMRLSRGREQLRALLKGEDVNES